MTTSFKEGLLRVSSLCLSARREHLCSSLRAQAPLLVILLSSNSGHLKKFVRNTDYEPTSSPHFSTRATERFGTSSLSLPPSLSPLHPHLVELLSFHAFLTPFSLYFHSDLSVLRPSQATMPTRCQGDGAKIERKKGREGEDRENERKTKTERARERKNSLQRANPSRVNCAHILASKTSEFAIQTKGDPRRMYAHPAARACLARNEKRDVHNSVRKYREPRRERKDGAASLVLLYGLALSASLSNHSLSTSGRSL